MITARTMLATYAMTKLQWQDFRPMLSRGEVAPSYGDEGVMSIILGAYDPSAHFAGTSPSMTMGRQKSVDDRSLNHRPELVTQEPRVVRTCLHHVDSEQLLFGIDPESRPRCTRPAVLAD